MPCATRGNHTRPDVYGILSRECRCLCAARPTLATVVPRARGGRVENVSTRGRPTRHQRRPRAFEMALPRSADPEAAHTYRRDAAQWEQIHLLYGLGRDGVLPQSSRVLIVATMPDPIVATLSRRLHADLFGLAPEAPTIISRWIGPQAACVQAPAIPPIK